MSTTHDTNRTKGTTAVKRARVDLPASDRLRRQALKVTQDVKEMGGMATDAAQEKLDQFRDTASDYYEGGRDKALDVQRTVEQYIQEQPIKSVLIAASVGLLFGRFWMRR